MSAESDAVLASIDAALEAGDGARALRLADAALEKSPESADLHHARGAALRGLDRSEEALLAFARALEIDPEMADAYLDSAEVLTDDVGDDVAALDVLARADGRLREDVARAEVALLRGVALARLEDFTGALRAFEGAARLDPDNPDIPVEQATVLIEVLRIEEAEAALVAGLKLAEDNARAHQLLGFIADYTGRRREAEEHFRKAAALDPRTPARPPRLSESEFDAAVEAALKQVPEPFARHLANVEVSVENYADRDFCRRHDCSPMTLGLYVGTPLTLRDASGEQVPDRIVVFQRALENTSRDETELIEEIAVTLKHEIGHLLGFEEQDLVDRGYE